MILSRERWMAIGEMPLIDFYTQEVKCGHRPGGPGCWTRRHTVIRSVGDHNILTSREIHRFPEIFKFTQSRFKPLILAYPRYEKPLLACFTLAFVARDPALMCADTQKLKYILTNFVSVLRGSSFYLSISKLRADVEAGSQIISPGMKNDTVFYLSVSVQGIDGVFVKQRKEVIEVNIRQDLPSIVVSLISSLLMWNTPCQECESLVSLPASQLLTDTDTVNAACSLINPS